MRTRLRLMFAMIVFQLSYLFAGIFMPEHRGDCIISSNIFFVGGIVISALGDGTGNDSN